MGTRKKCNNYPKIIILIFTQACTIWAHNRVLYLVGSWLGSNGTQGLVLLKIQWSQLMSLDINSAELVFPGQVAIQGRQQKPYQSRVICNDIKSKHIWIFPMASETDWGRLWKGASCSIVCKHGHSPGNNREIQFHTDQEEKKDLPKFIQIIRVRFSIAGLSVSKTCAHKHEINQKTNNNNKNNTFASLFKYIYMGEHCSVTYFWNCVTFLRILLLGDA